MGAHEAARDALILGVRGRAASRLTPRMRRQMTLPNHPHGSENINLMAYIGGYLFGELPLEPLRRYLVEQIDGTTGMMRREALSKIYAGWMAVAIYFLYDRTKTSRNTDIGQIAREWLEAYLALSTLCAVPTVRSARRFWRGSTILWPGQRTKDVTFTMVEVMHDFLLGTPGGGFRRREFVRRARQHNWMWPLWLLTKMNAESPEFKPDGRVPTIWMPVRVESWDNCKVAYQLPNQGDAWNTNTPPLLVAGAYHNGRLSRPFLHHDHPYNRGQFRRMSPAERYYNLDRYPQIISTSIGKFVTSKPTTTQLPAGPPKKTVTIPSILKERFSS